MIDLSQVPVTLQYQSETLYLVPEYKEISGLYRVVFVNRAGVAKFMTFIGENTVIDWNRIEAENTAPHTPEDYQRKIPSMTKQAIYKRDAKAKKKAALVKVLSKRKPDYAKFIQEMETWKNE